ncbi:MAG: NnrU family protein, partial [Rhizobium altiplani]|uniref:NnrU family protein n=1 Tax=Rhizobium altiplani TaxID=1864509 RepID=UPI0030F00085
MTLLIVGIIIFLGLHLIRVIAPGFRQSMVDSLGENGWKLAYSIVSILALILLIYGFGQARQVTGLLYTPPVWMAHITLTLM